MERGESGMLPSGMGSSSGMLGLEMHLNSHNHQPNPMLPSPFQHVTAEHHHAGPPIRHHSPSPYAGPYVVRGARQSGSNSNNNQALLDQDDQARAMRDADDGASKRPLSQPGQQQGCPWARMKWSESMVRLLIAEVYRVGDDGGGGADGDHHPCTAGKGGGGGGGGGANRAGGAAKGKWKSVSKAMMDKGFSVSPQQCEDKFNDLNKRYKRVVDLLGKGTACGVVENPSLLESMENLTPKAKEEARKLLSSKHLFFPEMCHYHNAGSGGCAGPSAVPPSSSHSAHLPSSEHQQQLHHHQQQQRVCSHHPSGTQHAHAASSDEKEEESSDDVSNEESSDDKDGEYDTDSMDGIGEDRGAKRARTGRHNPANSPPLSLSLSPVSGGTAVQQLKNELMGMSAAGGGDGVKQWVKRRVTELEEQRVGYQCRAYQLEKQRFKWLRFSSNKEREMERMRLQNDRLRLENERMLLLLRQKELELTAADGPSGRAGGGGAAAAAAASSTDQLHIQHQQQQTYVQK